MSNFLQQILGADKCEWCSRSCTKSSATHPPQPAHRISRYEVAHGHGDNAIHNFGAGTRRESPRCRDDFQLTGSTEHVGISMEDGTIYTSRDGRWLRELLRDTRHGNGELVHPDAERYKGACKDDHSECYSFSNGDKYEGQWKEDGPHGHGKYTNKDGSYIYEGQWEHNAKSGRGRETFSDGSYYDGEFLQGSRHGDGEYMTAGNNRYNGQFKQGTFHGEGDYSWRSGKLYRGQWERGTISGYGKMTYPQGYFYDGEFLKGDKHGQGVFVQPDGSWYRGQWRNGKQHGNAFVKTRDGVPMMSRWECGKNIE